jgi:dihydroxyacetone kinase-like predicted kinase
VVVAGDRSAARVHVHGAAPDLAVAIGQRVGRLSDVTIVDLDAGDEPTDAPQRALALVALADADGLADLLASLGARVLRSGSELAEAVRHAAAAIVLVAGDEVPPAGLPTAAGTPLIVRDAGALVAAALAFDPDAPADVNRQRMGAEAARVRTFAIHDGGALVEETLAGLRRHAGYAFELVTLYAGPAVGSEALDEVRAAIASAWPTLTVDAVLAGQAHDALLVALD